jgi:hypothetical protein
MHIASVCNWFFQVVVTVSLCTRYQVTGNTSAKDTVFSTVLLKLLYWTELPCGRDPKLGGFWAAGIGQWTRQFTERSGAKREGRVSKGRKEAREERKDSQRESEVYILQTIIPKGPLSVLIFHLIHFYSHVHCQEVTRLQAGRQKYIGLSMIQSTVDQERLHLYWTFIHSFFWPLSPKQYSIAAVYIAFTLY